MEYYFAKVSSVVHVQTISGESVPCNCGERIALHQNIVSDVVLEETRRGQLRERRE